MSKNKTNAILPIQILFEDEHFIAINKPCGIPSQPDLTGDISLLDYADNELNKNFYVVHRIDRPVSGVIFFAKNDVAADYFAQILTQPETQKTYWAIVNNSPPKKEDTLNHFIEHDTKKNKARVYAEAAPNAKPSQLNYKLLSESDNYFLLEVTLQTGRFHQIRAQLAHIGCPIKGDVKYGARRAEKNKSIGLHAEGYKFKSFMGEIINVTAPPPDEPIWNHFVEAVKKLR